MSSHVDLIDDLGGGTKLAAALTGLVGEPVDREAVYKWKENGIPWRWRQPVAVLAERAGVRLPEKFIEVFSPGGPAPEAAPPDKQPEEAA